MRIRFKEVQGFHRARLIQIKEETGIYGPCLKLIFTITEGELAHYRFTGVVKPTPIKQGKFYRWVTNIIGREPEDEFCTEEMIDKECMVYLSKCRDFYSVPQVSMLVNE